MSLTPVTGVIPSFKYMDAATTDTTGGWIPLQYDQVEKCTFHNEWGDTTATIAVEVSNDPRCFEGHPDAANADFDDITSSLTITDPSGSSGDGNINISDISFGFVRMKITTVSGGNFTSYFAAHS